MSDAAFLTDEELRELTGLEQPAAQERLLRSWGLSVYRNRANKVKLSREALARWQLGERASSGKPAEPRLRFDLLNAT